MPGSFLPTNVRGDLPDRPADSTLLSGVVDADGIFVYNAGTGLFNILREGWGDNLPTTGVLASGNMIWNGQGWDRLLGTAGSMQVSFGSEQANIARDTRDLLQQILAELKLQTYLMVEGDRANLSQVAVEDTDLLRDQFLQQLTQI